MKEYQFYIYGRTRDGKFCRLIFFIDSEDQEQFLKAEVKKNTITQSVEMSRFQAINFINDNKLRLIDEFKTKI